MEILRRGGGRGRRRECIEEEEGQDVLIYPISEVDFMLQEIGLSHCEGDDGCLSSDRQSIKMKRSKISTGYRGAVGGHGQRSWSGFRGAILCRDRIVQ